VVAPRNDGIRRQSSCNVRHAKIPAFHTLVTVVTARGTDGEIVFRHSSFILCLRPAAFLTVIGKIVEHIHVRLQVRHKIDVFRKRRKVIANDPASCNGSWRDKISSSDLKALTNVFSIFELIRLIAAKQGAKNHVPCPTGVTHLRSSKPAHASTRQIALVFVVDGLGEPQFALLVTLHQFLNLPRDASCPLWRRLPPRSWRPLSLMR